MHVNQKQFQSNLNCISIDFRDNLLLLQIQNSIKKLFRSLHTSYNCFFVKVTTYCHKYTTNGSKFIDNAKFHKTPFSQKKEEETMVLRAQ